MKPIVIRIINQIFGTRSLRDVLFLNQRATSFLKRRGEPKHDEFAQLVVVAAIASKAGLMFRGRERRSMVETKKEC